MKRYLILCCLLVAFLFGNSDNNNNLSSKKKEFIVVIDAGHGGKDPGAVGKFSKEKDITLDLTLRVGQYIEDNIPGVKVIYTRTTDVFLELYKRAEIANKAHADFFISIHCNAAASTKAHGFETWVMGLHKNADNLEVAKKENAAMLLEEDYGNQYEGFDPNSDETYITLSLFQDLYLAQSTDLAIRIQDQFRERMGKVDRSVKQAGFYVLWKTSMPGVLIEAGFISNAEEEVYINSEEGKTDIASAIYRAFKEYYISNYGRIPENINVDNQSTNTEITSLVVHNKAIYKVQFAVSSTKIAISDKRFSEISDVDYYEQSGMYKYVSGNFEDINQAIKHQNSIREKGYSDAFLVAFHNGKRITISEAKQINQ